MRKFLVYANSQKDENFLLTKKIEEYILWNGGECIRCVDIEKIELTHTFDCVIVLGGDGTILRVAHALEGALIPIVGINLGTLGFLAEVEPSNVYELIDCLFQDEYQLENRMQLEGIVYREGMQMVKSTALNDIVISRAGYSRIICLKIYVNGELLDVYEADGVIISTPTGSTGYNLSAGGPIVSPKANLILVTPISPHSLTSKSIVFSNEDTIKIEVVPKRKSQKEEAIATFDGSAKQNMQPGDCIEIQKAQSMTQLIKINKTNFYEVLRTKIGYRE